MYLNTLLAMVRHTGQARVAQMLGATSLLAFKARSRHCHPGILHSALRQYGFVESVPGYYCSDQNATHVPSVPERTIVILLA